MARMRAGMIAAIVSVTLAATAAAQTPQQAVLETTAGTIVWDLLAERAPNHVALFIKTAQSGALDGTTFHRMVRYGIVQGGDPVTKDPAARDKYGSGGLNQLKTEISDEQLTRGAVAAVQVPGKPDSAGTQFFMCVNAQPSLDGKYTVFARVVEGILVAQKISETPVDDKGLATERVVLTRVTIRDKPAATPEPFSTETVEDLARYRAVLETSIGSNRAVLRAGQGAEPRAQLPEAGAVGRVRRHGVPSRGEGFCHSDRGICRRESSRSARTSSPTSGRSRPSSTTWCTTWGRCRWPGPTIPTAPPPLSSW